MQFFENAVLYPDAEHFNLLKMIVAILTFIYFTYVAIFTGCASLSVFFNILNRREPNSYQQRFSLDLLHFITDRKSAIFLLGVLPLFTMAFTYAQLYQGTSFDIVRYYFIITGFTIVGFVLTIIYKNFMTKPETLLLQLTIGLAGIASFVLSFFILSNTISLQFAPEKWGMASGIIPFFIHGNVLPRFFLLTAYVFSITGAAVLFFFFKWPERVKLTDEKYAAFVKKVSAALSLSFILLQPVFVTWGMLTLPVVAKSNAVFISWLASLIFMFLISIFLFSILTRTDTKYVTITFVLFLLSFLTITVSDQIAGERASLDKAQILIGKAEEIHKKILEAREERVAASMQIDGAQIFGNICSACHKFDVKVVGPPLNTVKEKYQNDVAALNAFIANPVKIRPDFPPMPKQPLNKFEIAAVADYLVTHWKEESAADK